MKQMNGLECSAEPGSVVILEEVNTGNQYQGIVGEDHKVRTETGVVYSDEHHIIIEILDEGDIDG